MSLVFPFGNVAVAHDSTDHAEYTATGERRDGDTDWWDYTVTQLNIQTNAVSHVSVQLCFSEEELEGPDDAIGGGDGVLEGVDPDEDDPAIKEIEVGPDPSTALATGDVVKWNFENEAWTSPFTFSLKLNKEYPVDPEGAAVIVKFGAHATKVVVPGPDCDPPKDPKTFSIWGYKFNDLDGDGPSEDDPRLDNWMITLALVGEGVSDEYETGSGEGDETGAFHFENLDPGTYEICEVQQEGWHQTHPETHNGCHEVTITDSDVDGVLFGNQEDEEDPELGSIHAFKFSDTDGDGIFDEGIDSPIPGWEICLHLIEEENNGIGILNNFDSLLLLDEPACEETDKDGWVWWMNLLPGEYEVSEEERDGWMNTTDNNPEFVTLDEGNLSEGVEVFFGNHRNKITGTKFNDENNKGERDEGEQGLEGWTITFWDGDEKVGEETTDEDGNYESSFPVLTDVVYTVCEEQQEDWEQTFPETEDGCHEVELPHFSDEEDQNPDAQGIDFGNHSPEDPFEIHAFKFNDENENGEFDEGEAEVPDWEVCLYQLVTQGEGETTRVLISCQDTDEDGWVWWMDDLNEGTYEVEEEVQENWTNTTDNNPATVELDDENRSAEVWFGNHFDEPEDTTSGGGGGTIVTSTPEPVLTIVKSVTPSFTTPGGELRYTITLSNTGDGSAINVVLTDVLPAGFVYAASTDTGDLEAPTEGVETYSWNVGTLTVGSSVTVNYNVTVPGDAVEGTYVNRASANAANHPEVTGDANVEIRPGEVLGESIIVEQSEQSQQPQGEVKGASTLPETGGAPQGAMTFILVSLAVLGFYSFGVQQALRRRRVALDK